MFVLETTADGSPTVRIQNQDGSLSEAMHSLRGALSETVYIYGTAISTCLERNFSPRVLSMGLGLGYVELLSSALFLKAGVPFEKRSGQSFEILPELRDGFSQWLNYENGGQWLNYESGSQWLNPQPQTLELNLETSPSSPSSVLFAIYDDVLRHIATTTGIEAAEIRMSLNQLVRRGQWRISAELDRSTEFSEGFGCICFDAFSAKSSPDLWSEDFLTDFFTRASAPVAVVSTYACTGSLKRALRACGFEVKIRPGFSSKRDSTFAVRDAHSATANSRP